MKERAIETLHVASDDGFAAENIANDASLATSDTQQKKRIWTTEKTTVVPEALLNLMKLMYFRECS